MKTQLTKKKFDIGTGVRMSKKLHHNSPATQGNELVSDCKIDKARKPKWMKTHTHPHTKSYMLYVHGQAQDRAMSSALVL